MLSILHTLVLLLFGIPISIFGLYGIVLLCFSSFRKKESGEEGEEFEPYVSIVVPTHNEEVVISRKIDNMLHLDYPKDKLEMIFADDSDDATPSIIEEHSKKFSQIHLMRFRERMGYSPSMVAGCKATKGEIIVLNDAGSFMDVQAIRNLVRHFQNLGIGVVTGRSIILNAGEEVGEAEKLYLKMVDFLRRAESQMDSTFWIKGEATAVRKELIKDLETCSETFDTTVGLCVRRKGYRVVFDPHVTFYEYAPSTHSGRVKQKTVRAANLVKVLWRFRHLMFKRKYGKYGCIILPMNFGMLVIAPLAIFIGFTFLIALTFFDSGFSAIIWSISGSLFLVFLIFSRHLLLTFLEFEYSLLKALYQTVFTKRAHDKIDKISSTRRY